MSLTLPQLLACLARCQGEEVAPALVDELGPEARAYAAGSAGTAAMLLGLAAADAATATARQAAAAGDAAMLLGATVPDRDSRQAALGAALEAAEAAGDRQRRQALLAVLAGEAAAECAALGIALP